MKVIKVDPTARYVVFVRGVDPQWVETVQESLCRWLESDSKLIMVNIPGQGQVALEKLRVEEDNIETVY